MTALPPLPNELFFQVIEHLESDNHTLLQVMLVNSMWYGAGLAVYRWHFWMPIMARIEPDRRQVFANQIRTLRYSKTKVVDFFRGTGRDRKDDMSDGVIANYNHRRPRDAQVFREFLDPFRTFRGLRLSKLREVTFMDCATTAANRDRNPTFFNEHMTKFFQPQLRSLTLIDSPMPTDYSSFSNLVWNQCPNLERLHLENNKDMDCEPYEFISLLQNLEHLQSITLRDDQLTTQPVVNYLFSRQGLQEVWLHTGSRIDEQQMQNLLMASTSYPHMKELTLWGQPDTIRQMIAEVPSLESLNTNTPNLSDLVPAMQTLTDLKHLRLWLSNNRILKASDLLALTPLTLLENIEIGPSFALGFEESPSDMRVLTSFFSSFPHLKSFHIQARGNVGPMSLSTLGQACPRLEYLDMKSLHVHMEEDPGRSATTLLPNLWHFHVGRLTPIENDRKGLKSAKILARQVPALVSAQCWSFPHDLLVNGMLTQTLRLCRAARRQQRKQADPALKFSKRGQQVKWYERAWKTMLEIVLLRSPWSIHFYILVVAIFVAVDLLLHTLPKYVLPGLLW